MKKIVSLSLITLMLALFSACENMDKPSPMDTNPTFAPQSNAYSDIPNGSEMSDDQAPIGRSGVEGMIANYPEGYWENIPAEDIITTIYFGFDKFSVEQGERSKVSKAVQEMAANDTLNVAFVGHTDFYGTEEYNLTLSDKRSSSVSEYMSAQNIDTYNRGAVVARGKNGSTPNVAKESPQAKKDRRVDIVRLH